MSAQMRIIIWCMPGLETSLDSALDNADGNTGIGREINPADGE